VPVYLHFGVKNWGHREEMSNLLFMKIKGSHNLRGVIRKWQFIGSELEIGNNQSLLNEFGVNLTSGICTMIGDHTVILIGITMSLLSVIRVLTALLSGLGKTMRGTNKNPLIRGFTFKRKYGIIFI
jgi:hypothetical protein